MHSAAAVGGICNDRKTGRGLRSVQVTPAKRSATPFPLPRRHNGIANCNGIVNGGSDGLHARRKAPYSACRYAIAAAPADDARPIPTAGDHLRRSVVAAKTRRERPFCDGSRTRYRKIMSLVLYPLSYTIVGAISTIPRQNPYTEHTAVILSQKC